ncbi:hypothetical protein [Psychromonas algicola]|uniref:hypothetical protein n=1 Tax=Psychromonas algicola TaxID=2555642 RepID=UPI00106772A8|nr:hypothetical protein [Psychromonas sp. RZ5]TEW52338.1 hypothetical protein E2R67_03235 [Psychromonas sp. RZ5]
MTDAKSNNSSFSIPSVIQRYVLDLDSYDDPCFVFVYSKGDPVRRFNVLESLFETELEDDFSLFKLNDDICFASLFCDYIDMENIAENIVNTFKQQDIMVNVSVFRHNPIGVAKDTFYWGIKQLESLAADKNSASFMINDFTDTKNWPGIAQYTDKNTGLVDTVEVKNNVENKQGFFKQKLTNLKKLVSKVDTETRSMNNNSEADNLTPSLKMLHPFMINLPQGELFWQYVLNGEYEQQLKDSNAFIDLDKVVLLSHAKKVAPDFFKHILSCSFYDSVPSQNEIHGFLFKILEPLSKELLKTGNTTSEQKACFLRILDIFFYLFDQQDFEPNIFELLTESMRETSYAGRFSVVCEETAEGISPEQEREIIEILAAIDNYYVIGNENLSVITHCFSGARNAYDYTLWENDESSSLLLAAILLNLDKKEQIKDHYTEALTQFFDDQLLENIMMVIAENSSFVPESLSPWLQGDDSIDVDSLIQALRTSLTVDWQSDVNSPQPVFELFSDISDFLVILASCYWRLNASHNETADRLIKLMMGLAPQATLSCFSRLYRSSLDGFSSIELEETFFQCLTAINIDKYAQVAFKLRIAFNYCFEQYEPLLNEYVQLNDQEKAHWDNAIDKFNAYDRDYFYLDVYRINPELSNPLAEKNDTVLAELVKLASHDDNKAFANHFDKNKVMFADHSEDLPRKLELPVTFHTQRQPNKAEMNFAVLLCTGKHHELLIDSASHCVENEGEWPAVNSLTILENVEATEVIETLHKMPTIEQRTLINKQAIKQYIEGEISFTEYIMATSAFLNTKEFYLDNDLYSEHAPKILPQILAEPNKAKQLRWVKLLSTDPRRRKRVQEELIAELFFDHQLQEGNVDLETRKEIELEELSPSWAKTWQDYHQQLTAELAKI